MTMTTPSPSVDLQSEQSFVKDRFVPTLSYVRESGSFHSRLCIYNYFSEIFPAVPTGALARLWFFDSTGDCIGHREVPLGFRGQLQFEVREIGSDFEGMAAVSLVPETVPEIRHRGVGTGYYVCYYDDAGHADLSHEWDHMRFEPAPIEPWLCVVRPLVVPDTQLVVMNSYFGPDAARGVAHWTARLRSGDGRILAERRMPPLAPRGCVRLRLDEIFPAVQELAARTTLAVEVSGENVFAPFTYVNSPSGDFNIHHFC
jgi:hypothetical protein